MERIKIHTNNARDRMEIMQKRYHEYKDSIQNGNSDSNRASLNASPFEVCYLTNYFIQILVTKTFTTIFFVLIFFLLVCLCKFFALQRINNDNRNSANRSNSFGARLRSGSLSNFASTFKNGNARFIQNINDFDDTTTQDDGGTLSDSRSRAFSSSVQDLNGGRNNPNWQMPPQQFGPPFGFMPNQPFQYHVIKMQSKLTLCFHSSMLCDIHLKLVRFCRITCSRRHA